MAKDTSKYFLFVHSKIKGGDPIQWLQWPTELQTQILRPCRLDKYTDPYICRGRARLNYSKTPQELLVSEEMNVLTRAMHNE